MQRRNLHSLIIIGCAAAVSSGCGRGARIQAEERAKVGETRLVQLDAITATKDSLVHEMMATTSFINGLNEQLARANPASGKSTVKYDERVMPVSEYRNLLLARIDSVVTRLNENEARLKGSEERLHALAGKDKVLRAQLASLDSMVTSYKVLVEQQREQITQLTAQADTLRSNNTQLATEKAQLTEEKTELTTQVADMTNFANRVFYIIGTKKELLEKGVALEAGGARFLGIGWKSGKALVPARDLKDSVFTAISKPTEVEIVLPKPDKKYAIVSAQNVTYVETPVAKDGTYRGKIRITNPDAFWAPSKYLIVVER